MYDESVPCQAKESEHTSVARNMGNTIIEQFNQEQQNEMLRTIKQVISERMQLDIEEAEKKLAYIKDVMQNL